MADLTSQEKQYLLDRRTLQALLNIEPDKMPQAKGLIALFCGDGDQSSDLLNHLFSLQKTARAVPRIHCLTCNGGPLRLSPQSPVDKDGISQKFFADEIAAARTLKHIDTVVLVGHAPCGLAKLNKISVAETIEHYRAAKKYLKEKLVGPRTEPMTSVLARGSSRFCTWTGAATKSALTI